MNRLVSPSQDAVRSENAKPSIPLGVSLTYILLLLFGGAAAGPGGPVAG